MKFKFPFFLLLILTVVSCSSDELAEQEITDGLLKSYKLVRDSSGKYSIDYEMKEDTYADVITNLDSNTNEVHLFSGEVTVSKSQSEALVLEDDKLNIGFYENGIENSFLTLEDDDFILEEELLESYSLTNQGDGFFKLDFKVKEGVAVSYDYNEVLGVYEVYLNEGESKSTEFSKTYIKTNSVLKVDFISYNNGLAKSAKPGGSRGPRVSVTDSD